MKSYIFSLIIKIKTEKNEYLGNKMYIVFNALLSWLISKLIRLYRAQESIFLGKDFSLAHIIPCQEFQATEAANLQCLLSRITKSCFSTIETIYFIGKAKSFPGTKL